MAARVSVRTLLFCTKRIYGGGCFTDQCSIAANFTFVALQFRSRANYFVILLPAKDDVSPPSPLILICCLFCSCWWYKGVLLPTCQILVQQFGILQFLPPQVPLSLSIQVLGLDSLFILNNHCIGSGVITVFCFVCTTCNNHNYVLYRIQISALQAFCFILQFNLKLNNKDESKAQNVWLRKRWPVK